jgi:peptide/nickel transport system substrate-binding protein
VLLADPKSTLLSRQTFGAGPYVFVPSQSVVGDHCTFVPNRFYYDTSKIRWGKVITKPILDPNAALAAMKTGQIDVVQRAAMNTVQAAAAAGFKIVDSPGLVYKLWFLDLGGKLVSALADVRVRQALNYAVDRGTIAKALYGPGATTTSNPFTPGQGEVPRRIDNYFSYNPGKARSLLAAAGYPNGFTFKAVALGPWAGSVQAGNLCEAIAQNLAAVGVTMEVTTPTTDVDWGNEFGSAKYSAVCIPSNMEPSYYWYGLGFKPGAGFNQHGFDDPVIDKLWLKGERADPKSGARYWRQLATRWITRAYWIPVVEQPLYTYVSKRVGGVAPGLVIGVGLSDYINWYPIGQ